MLIACVVVFCGQLLWGVERSSLELGVNHDLVAAGQFWRMLTAGFAHGGMLHLVFNMFSLYVLGRVIEPVLAARGAWRFPTLYLGSLLGGSAGVLLLEPNSLAVGASGAVFGLMGAAMSVPARQGLGWNRLGVLPWVALNLVFTFANPGVSVGGHLGGLITGLGLGWLLAAPRRYSHSPFEN